MFIGRDEPNKINVYKGNSYALPSYCRFFIKIDNCSKCQKCKKLISKEWSYYCSNCNSQFCDNCYKYHKVIFDKNILIFDGNFADKENNFIKHGLGITFKRNNELNYKGHWINGEFDLIKNINHEHEFIRGILDDLQCKICKKMCNCYDPGIYCSRCKIYICDKCIIKLNEILSSLINCSIKNSSNEFICNFCFKKKQEFIFIHF